jgi:hypothetical protein
MFHVPWKDKAEMQTNENANAISSDARSAVKDWREIREPSWPSRVALERSTVPRKQRVWSNRIKVCDQVLLFVPSVARSTCNFLYIHDVGM